MEFPGVHPSLVLFRSIITVNNEFVLAYFGIKLGKNHGNAKKHNREIFWYNPPIPTVVKHQSTHWCNKSSKGDIDIAQEVVRARANICCKSYTVHKGS